MSIDVNVQNDLVIVTESSEDITVNVSNAAGPAGVGVPTGGTTGQVLKKFTNTDYDTYWAADASGLTSVGLSMPSAFTVSNTPLTTNGTIAVSGAGTASQYVRGDGQLANFPTNGGGGSSVNYYLNGSVNQGTFGGDTYYEMSKTPIIGTGTNFTRTNAQGNGYIASFITDAGDPALLNIPGGNWNVEFYFSASSGGGTPSFYAELYKVSSSNVFTLIASGSTNPEGITQGTVIDQYFTSIPVPQTSLLVTDRLAIRIFVTPSGRTITLHTEDNNLCEVLTTFSTGLNALNGLTSQVQYFATGTSGTNFNISSATDTHTFNLPTASATNRGALSSADWSTFNNKVPPSRTLTINGTAFDLSADRSWTIAAGITGSGVANQLTYWNGTGSVTGSAGLVYNDSTGVMTLSKNQNAAMGFLVQNTNSGSSSTAEINMISDGGRIFAIFKKSSTATPFKIMLSSDASLYNSGAGDISMLNDVAAGKIKFTAGAAGVAQMTLTAAGRLLLGTTTESTFILDAVGTARVSGDARINGAFIGRGLGNISTNTILGKDVLRVNTTGSSNTSVGDESMYSNTTGSANTAHGYNTLTFNVSGTNNVAVGSLALRNGTTLAGNTAIGHSAGLNVNSGNNTLIGQSAGVNLTTGGANTFVGDMSGFDVTTGSNNIIIGRFIFASTIPNNINDNIIFGTSGIVKFRMFDTGNLVLQNGGTFTDAGFRLDVNGTARVSDNLTVEKNQNAGTSITIKNTNTGSGAAMSFSIQGDSSSTVTSFGRYSVANPGYLSMKGGDTIIFHNSDSPGGIVLQTSGSAGGFIKFASGGSSTPQMTLTAAGRLLLGTTTEGTNILEVADTSSFGTNNFTNKLNAKFGTFGIQSSAINNGFLADNIFYNGTSWTRTNTGYGYTFQFYNGQVIFHGVNTGTGNFTANNTMKVDYAGNFLLGQNLSATTLDFTNASLRFTNNGRLLLGTTTENSSALLNVTSTTQGFLPPRMTTTQKNAIATPAAGLVVYDTTLNQMSYYNGTTWVNF